MRLAAFSRCRCVAVIWLAGFWVFLAHGGQGMGPTIRVEGEGWGQVEKAEIQAVLESVAEQLITRPSPRLAGTIVVTHGSGSPVTLYEKGAQGTYQVRLSASDRRWAQYAYQFGHELCHVMSNFEVHSTLASNNQWFEEALCEAAGLHALRGMAVTWKNAPPYPAWADYAQAFRDYATHLAREPHRKLPGDTGMATWLQQNLDELRGNPYRREKNEVVAMQLLPLFESDAGNWASLYALNRNPAVSSMSFPDYLRCWHRDAQGASRDFVGKIMTLLAISTPSAPGPANTPGPMISARPATEVQAYPGGQQATN